MSGNLGKLTMAIVLGTLASVSNAQVASPSTIGAQAVSDVFIGRNANGPYLLSWKVVDAGSVTIYRGAIRQQAGTDYTLDSAQGALVFTRALKQREIARADYRIDPRKSVKNAQSGAPMQFKLLEGLGGALSMDALYRPEPMGPSLAKTAADAAPGAMLLGFSAAASPGKDSQMKVRLLMDARGANLLDRGAMQLIESSRFSLGEFKAGYTRAGAGFQGAKETGIRSGAEVMEIGATTSAIRGFQAAASFIQTTDLPAGVRGAVTQVLAQKLSGSLGPRTRLQASRTETAVASPGGGNRDKVANRLQVDHRFGATTSATALLEQSEATSGGKSLVTQTGTLNLRSRPLENLSLTGSFQNRLLPTGAEDAADLRIEAEPSRNTRLLATIGERYTKQGARHTREASFEFKPSSLVSLTTGLNLRADGDYRSAAGLFGAALKPVPWVEIAGMVRARGATSRGVPDPEAVDTYDVKSSVALFGQGLRLTGAAADNPEDDKGNVLRLRRRSIGLASGVGRASLEASFGREEFLQTPASGETADLKLSWRLGGGTLLGARFLGSDRRDGDRLQTSTHSFSLSHRVGDSLDFSLLGSMTREERNGALLPNPDYRAEARVAIRL